MARKLRLEEAGGLYHVFNRGNYRQPIFGNVGAARAFERTLMEALPRFDWRLHACAILPNQYNLALETPTPNLVAGMHWLQSTYATRFNRLRQERGHLFQGRYHALPIEDAATLSRVADYIHCKPALEKLVPPEHLGLFRWSSLRAYLREENPQGLTGSRIAAHRKIPNTPTGWKMQEARLIGVAHDTQAQENLGFPAMERGWAIGSRAWKTAIARDVTQKDLAGLAAEEARGIRETRWNALLEQELAAARRTPKDLTPLLPRTRGEPWRFALATRLRAAGAPHTWIANTLGYPSPASLRVRLHRSLSARFS